METTKKFLMIALLVQLSTSIAFAQEYSWKKPPQPNEKEIDMILDTVLHVYEKSEDQIMDMSVEQLYDRLQKKAKEMYEDKYPNFALRNFMSRSSLDYVSSANSGGNSWYKMKVRRYYTSASVVILSTPKPTENSISKAIDKALMEVREGSRIAIDQVRVTSGINKEDYKDEVVEILLDKGFKVVAKDYLERLYEEQQSQQSGIYNEKTTVKENNLSAVGYYLNVKLTETALRVQVVNVSTGEYEGNVTIKLQEK